MSDERWQAGVPPKLPFYFEHYTIDPSDHDPLRVGEGRLIIECGQCLAAKNWLRSQVEVEDYPFTPQRVPSAVWAHQREYHQPKGTA